jgi:hypothetical protein
MFGAWLPRHHSRVILQPYFRSHQFPASLIFSVILQWGSAY